jgi:hypothetical protein
MLAKDGRINIALYEKVNQKIVAKVSKLSLVKTIGNSST